jgi:hypothetical protein
MDVSRLPALVKVAIVGKDAVARLERDLEILLVHYDFPRAYWASLRTTNPIERVNKNSSGVPIDGAPGIRV